MIGNKNFFTGLLAFKECASFDFSVLPPFLTFPALTLALALTLSAEELPADNKSICKEYTFCNVCLFSCTEIIVLVALLFLFLYWPCLLLRGGFLQAVRSEGVVVVLRPTVIVCAAVDVIVVCVVNWVGLCVGAVAGIQAGHASQSASYVFVPFVIRVYLLQNPHFLIVGQSCLF